MICDVNPDALPPINRTGLDANTACPVDQARLQMEQAIAQSCGRDVFCREATRQVHTILTDISMGQCDGSDLDLIDEICSLMAEVASCELAATAARRTVGLLRERREEWELHRLRKRCTSLTCRMSFTVYIAPDACTGCVQCIPVCPENAISGDEGLIHVVSTDACTRCLACFPACPAEAIRKAGPVKPKVPASPVPVGSFAAAEAPGAGMTRRRRRST